MVDNRMEKYYGDVAKKLAGKANSVRLSRGVTNGDIASAYEDAGDAYWLSGDTLTAKKYYTSASRYAHDKKSDERISDKRKGILDIHKVKERIRTISSLEKKAIEEPVEPKKKKKSSFWNMSGFSWDRALKPNYPFEPKKDYNDYLFVVLGIGSLLSALFFSASSMTGYAISSLTNDDSRWIGLCLFVCGLIFSFIYLRQRDKF